MLWVVIYQTTMGFIYGWLCKALNASEAEEQFRDSTIILEGKTIKCIAQMESATVGAFFSLYEQEPYSD
jgi:hypothetical protein